MLFPDSGKRDLRDLLTQAAHARARMPASATALARALATWQADADARLGALVLRVKAADLAALRARLAELTTLADGLATLLAEAAQWQRAEAAFAAERAAQPDRALADWFAARAEPRLARLAAAAVGVDDDAGLAAVRAGLARDAEQRDFDRQLFDLFREAAERTRPFTEAGGAAPIRALADALPDLRARLLGAGRPERELVLALREAVAAARALAARPKPPQLDECFGLIEGMTAWVEVLRDGVEPGVGATPELDRRERALQNLSARYGALAQHWQQQEEGAFAALIEAAAGIEGALLALAKAEQATLTARLERSRALFQQYADASLSAGLGERIGALLAATPDSPATFQRWREQCRRAQADFERAIGADSHRLEAQCGERAEAVRVQLAALGQAPLSAAARVAWSLHSRRLTDLPGAADRSGGVTALLGLLHDLGVLHAEVLALAARVAALAARVATRRQGLTARAARLAETSAGLVALGLAAPCVVPRPTGADGPDLDQTRRELAAWRGRLLAGELALLRHATPALAARAADWARLHGCLDADLAGPIVPPALAATPRPRFTEIARLGLGYAPTEAALAASLAVQAERLRVAADAVRTALLRADAAGWSAPERAVAGRLASALAQAGPAGAPRESVPQMRGQLAEAATLLARLEQARERLDRLAAHLSARLERLRRDCFELDAGPASGGVLAERVWALLQPVRGLLPPPAQRRAQLREADELLAALERHAPRLVALRLGQALACLTGQPAAAALVAQLAADPLTRPPADLRRQVYQFAEASLFEPTQAP